jgi:aspartyl protease family protein
MRFASQLVAVSVLMLSAAPSVPMATEAVVLRPFVGETVQEFEARKRGVRLDQVDGKGGVLTVPADPTGHFFVEPTLGGQRIRMLVDTGASLVALSHEDAERVSISVSARDFTKGIATANGVVEAAPVRIPQIQVGDIVVRNVEAVVLPPGRLNISLLGMTFLRRLSTFEITDGRLALRQ